MQYAVCRLLAGLRLAGGFDRLPHEARYAIRIGAHNVIRLDIIEKESVDGVPDAARRSKTPKGRVEIMKILGICCSPRKNRTTSTALAACLKAAREADPEAKIEQIELAGLTIHGCRACGKCKEGLDCGIDDDFRQLIPRLAEKEVRAMIIATPVYMGSMSSQCKAFLDRTLPFRRLSLHFRNRVGGVLAVGGSRNGGQELAIQAVHAAMLIHDMVLAGDGPDHAHFGGTLWNPGDRGIDSDQDGMQTARNLGKRVMELAMRLKG